ncbi:MAG TPA: hypothetical protein VIP57_07890 [Candidatus Dormibacteraeota bacterium]
MRQRAPREIVRLFGVYLARYGFAVPGRGDMGRNLAAKAALGAFEDARPLLRPGIRWDIGVSPNAWRGQLPCWDVPFDHLIAGNQPERRDPKRSGRQRGRRT